MDQIIKEMGIDCKSMISQKYNTKTNMLNKRKSMNDKNNKDNDDINLNEKDKN